MNHSSRPLAVLCATWLLAALAPAGTEYEIEVNGRVEFNSIGSGPFSTVGVGEQATLSFRVDSDHFIDSPSFPTRGYLIDKTSWALAFESGTASLQNPYSGPNPMFVLRDNDPAVDGFLVSTSVDFPQGVPLAIAGIFGPFENSFHVTYGGEELSSLDIAGAVGHYDFTGLTVFNWTIDDGPFNPLGLIFEDMTVTEVVQGEAVVYGCGLNPAGSMTVLGGSPAVGEVLQLGVDNPSGTQSPGSLPWLYIAVAPDANFPCGTPLPGFGMSAAGAAGELLIDITVPNVVLQGLPWAGAGQPSVFSLPIPGNPALSGSTFYAQGILLDFSPGQGVPVGLTDAVRILVGN